jgi:Tfp pilus assembly protein PilE
MPQEWESKSRRGFRNYLLISTAVILALAAYTSWVLYTRSSEVRKANARAAEAQSAKEREGAKRAYETLGGSEFAILNFYALPNDITQGQASTLCYGVSNARAVRLEPPAAELWPSASRCFDVSPQKTTKYQLTIEDRAGHTKTASVEIKVR